MPLVGKAARTFPEPNQSYVRTALAENLRAGGNRKETELFQAAPDGQAQHHGARQEKERQFHQ
jgi:hypothetical protein